MVRPDVNELAALIDTHHKAKKEDSPHKRRAGPGDDPPYTGWWSFTGPDGALWLSPQVDPKHMALMLKNFASLLKKLETLNKHLLSFITASRTVTPAMCDEAHQLREGLTSLYLTIYDEVEKVQNTWFTDPDFEQFWVKPPADLVLPSQYDPDPEEDQQPDSEKDQQPDPEEDKRLEDSINHISTVLQKLDQISASMFGDTIMEARLQKFFKPVKNLRNTKFRGAVPYTISHPLPNIIRKFNDFMSGITVVFAQWAENDVPAIIHARDRHVSNLQNTSTVAIFFSGVSATALQYSGGINSGYTTPFNFLWLLSLLLSTASAMQCQLGIFWHTSRSRRTQKRVSHFVKLVTSRIPLILLGVATAAFLTGLAFFSFQASSKHSFLAIGVTSAICFVGAVMLWFILWLLCRHDLVTSTPRKPRREV